MTSELSRVVLNPVDVCVEVVPVPGVPIVPNGLAVSKFSRVNMTVREMALAAPVQLIVGAASVPSTIRHHSETVQSVPELVCVPSATHPEPLTEWVALFLVPTIAIMTLPLARVLGMDGVRLVTLDAPASAPTEA